MPETSDYDPRSKRPGHVTSRRSRHREGHNEVGGPVDLQTVETVRHDADHRRRYGVDLDRLADAGTIPEDASAETLAEDDRRFI